MIKAIEGHRYVLAIDPALSTTGLAVLDIDTAELVFACKFTTSPKDPQDDRIMKVCTMAKSATDFYDITDVILEDGFSGTNLKTGLQLATLRGAIIATFRLANLHVCHLKPTQIRQMLECGGKASKEDVAEVVTKTYQGTPMFDRIGPYSDKQNKGKTSDIYDAISIGMAFIKMQKDGVPWTKSTT